MKFSGKMCLKIILKVTKNQGFTLSVEDAFFEKPQGGGWGVKLTPPSPSSFRVKQDVFDLLLAAAKKSCFSFDDSLYPQINGVAMGSL